MQAQHSAIKMLYSRVHLILDYVRAVKEGKVAANHEILREAYSLCHRLPVISNETFKEEYFNVSSRIFCYLLLFLHLIFLFS